ncbi:T-cell receptor beta-1 chain C region isoform X2 [Boleophthalmus pectinirostris]|uniref:T-cell receptor beta-1 chain C region isoform X2 n=1 Tax=Boleophthalmus pectinirostris TaxID=150288 RepID=UPI00242DB34E|nr:T-cell receptor beta-1 chain C region isoform X2 [Boleophthalmus pectinirostris]
MLQCDFSIEQVHCDSGTAEAYFGGGTKLTVLEEGLKPTPPKVLIFPPSENERPRNKEERKAKTLVCVARDFYPDHVTVSWKVNEILRTPGVSTDEAPRRIGQYYTISSRLRVDATEWNNPDNSFTCIVSFYDGTTHTDYPAEINGKKGNAQDDEGGLTRETYLKITQNAKLSYVVFIVKGVVYGLFVAFLVWKIPRSNGKQT